LWGKGTNGSTSQEVSLMLLDGIPAHRSIHQCNGGMFDEKFLDGYVREDPTDMTTKTKVIFQAEQARNEADGVTLVAATETYDLSYVHCYVLSQLMTYPVFFAWSRD
jgi:hypothetical protein